MTTLRAIDHVVVAVHHLEESAARLAGLGFTLTPRAQHPEGMGTSNRLIQFADQSFVELIEVDRPETLAPHDPTARFFGFGAHNRAFLEAGEGMSMLVFTGADASADAGRFREAGLGDYRPFDFGRSATLPDGSTVELAFSLAFATLPELPREAIFTCHNRFPQNFWKPAFQVHPNGAQGIASVRILVEDPALCTAKFEALTGGRGEATATGHVVALANDQQLELLPASGQRPGFAGVTLKGGAAVQEILWETLLQGN